MSERLLPEAFADLESWAPDWAKAGRDERYAMRKSKTFEELEAFYDAIAPHAEAAIEYLNARDLAALADEDQRLLQMLYSMMLVSCSVNIYRQVDIPDSGAAYFDTRIEPAV